MSDDPSVVLTIMFYAVPNTRKKLLVYRTQTMA